MDSPWKFYVSPGLEAAALTSASPGMKWLHPAFRAGNSQEISLGFLQLPLLRTTYWKFWCESGLSLGLWVWERGPKEQRQTCSRSQQMEDVISQKYQGPGRSPGEAGVSHFRSIQVNNNPTAEQNRAPQSCSWCLQSVRSWFFYLPGSLRFI